MKNRQQRKTKNVFNKHIKNEISCSIVGNSVSRDILYKYYNGLMQGDSKNGLNCPGQEITS